jgi:hypothetical protein
VKANADENPICSALGGGGGNFGVVTSFTFSCINRHALCRSMLYELSETADVMKWYRDLIPSAPDDLNGFFAFLTVPPAPLFRTSAHEKNVRSRVSTLDHKRKQKKHSRQSGIQNLHWISCCRSRRCKACSIRFIRRACNGTGAPIS